MSMEFLKKSVNLSDFAEKAKKDPWCQQDLRKAIREPVTMTWVR